MPKDESPALGGGDLSMRVLRDGEKLRPPERDDTSHAERLLSGEAWRDFSAAIERTGAFALHEAEGPRDARSLAEGQRYALGLVTLGIRNALEMGDPDYPSFARIEDPWAKWGAENVDNHYLHTNIRSDRSYRIRGTRGSCLGFLVEVKEGFMHMGDVRNFAVLSDEDLEVDADGRFEIVASRDEQPGNWLPLDPDATQILVRQYLCDWENEEPATFTIECLESEGQAPPAPSPAALSRVLDQAAHWTEMTLRFWAEWVPRMRETHVPGKIAPPRGFVGGADDIRYGNDLYRLGPDEALVFENDVPDARYWHVQLCNVWFVTMDYANRQNSLNHHQARIDGDGRFRCVIAHRDPGVANWLDTGGEPEGMIQYRYVWTKDSPEPTVRIVKWDELRSHLPADTPAFSPEERRAQIATRQRGIARRMRA